MSSGVGRLQGAAGPHPSAALLAAPLIGTDLRWLSAKEPPAVRDRRRPPNLAGVLPGEAFGFPLPGWWPGRHKWLSIEEAALASFAVAGWRVCEAVDAMLAGGGDPEGQLVDLHPVLANLYAAGANLPDLECEAEESPLHWMSYDDRLDLTRRLRDRLGLLDAYQELADPWTAHHAVEGSLAGDLAEVYADIKPGLLRLAQADRLEETVSSLRQGFLSHWGRRLASVTRVVYFLGERED
jgi:hypothetical protein